MPSPRRLWLWIFLALLVLLLTAFVLQAVNQLLWQLSYWLPGWLVGPLLLFLLAVLALTLVQFGWPWWRARDRSSSNSANTKPPPSTSRRQAAERNLASIEQILDRVRDAAERDALRHERQRMEEELKRGDLVIVVFGSGSSGKTSLIRALLREVVGEVGAAMGSTATASRYRLRLQGLKRAVILEDTPGILEAGVIGRERERQSRELAARADLLLLVVDGDLRASELDVMTILVSLGKRLLLVLNKCDLRGEREEKRLLELLVRRGTERLTAQDVIPTSAAPQTIPMPGGRPVQPEPEVRALVRRIAAVLHADGEELIADNLLLQCSHLGEASRTALERQRRADARIIVERYMWISAGILLVTPLPGVDLMAAAVVNAQMVMEIGRVYGVSLSRESAQDLALSVGRTLASLGLIKGGAALLGSALSLNLSTLLVSRTVQAVSCAWLTRVAGRSFIVYFRQDQDWGDGGLQEVLRREYELNQREGSLRQFLQTAFQRVVEPQDRPRGLSLPPQRRPQRPAPPEAEAAIPPENRAQ